VLALEIVGDARNNFHDSGGDGEHQAKKRQQANVLLLVTDMPAHVECGSLIFAM
jgi:hypothetical protein